MESLKGMSAALAKTGTGKRFQYASEDLGSYLKVESIQSSKSLYESALDSVNEAEAFLDVASAYATSLIDDLTDLKTEAYNRENTSGDEQTAAIARFDGLRTSIQETLSTSYDGVGLNVSADTTFQTVRLANGGSLALAFTNAADKVTYANTAWDNNYATTAGKIDTELGKINSFSAKVGGYQATIDAQDTFLSSMITNLESAETTITEINSVSELAKYVAYDIRQQSAVSMLAQANLSRKAILNLFD